MTSLISPRDTPSVPRIMSPDTIYVAPLSLVETTVEDAQCEPPCHADQRRDLGADAAFDHA